MNYFISSCCVSKPWKNIQSWCSCWIIIINYFPVLDFKLLMFIIYTNFKYSFLEVTLKKLKIFDLQSSINIILKISLKKIMQWIAYLQYNKLFSIKYTNNYIDNFYITHFCIAFWNHLPYLFIILPYFPVYKMHFCTHKIGTILHNESTDCCHLFFFEALCTLF